MPHYWQNKLTQIIVNLLGVLSSILLLGKLDAELDNISLGVLLGRHHTSDAGFDGIESGLGTGGLAGLGELSGLGQYVCDEPIKSLRC